MRQSLTSSHALLGVFAQAGIDRVFLVPGESYLGVLDALVDFPEIDTVTCRHEGGAGFMAVADSRLTGRPGVAMVSRGPGASHAAIAVHTAQQDAVPFILLIGQVAEKDLRREAFQEVDYQQMFGGIAKWVFECRHPSQLAETAAKAIQWPHQVLAAPWLLFCLKIFSSKPFPRRHSNSTDSWLAFLPQASWPPWVNRSLRPKTLDFGWRLFRTPRWA